ncbi:MAG: peptidoglycan DD-metalloendopeptidase family protein [Desulfocapsaceae bacterium]|nr:peptidoglycan DD-metalloendopeptidase family protein [Desulfocapsaceae bacterium]
MVHDSIHILSAQPSAGCSLLSKTLHCGLLLLLTAAVLFLFGSPLEAAADNAEKQQLETKINTHWINIRRLQEDIRLQQDQLDTNASQEKQLLSEMENIDVRQQEHRDKLAVLRDRMKVQQDLIALKEKELARGLAAKNAVQIHLQKRLSAYYKLGKIGLINVAFSAHSLPELLSFHDSFQSLIRHDQDLIDSYHRSINDLEKVKEAMTLEKNLLQEFITQEEDERGRAAATRQEKEDLLTLVRTKSKLHEKAIKEMREAGNNLSSRLAALQKKQELLDQGFMLNKGKLSPPVLGTIISRFNQEITNKLAISSKSNGISIKAPDGTKVHALFDGTILFSGYLKGYGNTIIIDHGYQYYSIVSRMEKLLKNKGDETKTGDIIGVMGDTATLIDEGLYLEIRHGSQSLDPMEWLDKDKISQNAAENIAPATAQ